jgi:hypothetical protein
MHICGFHRLQQLSFFAKEKLINSYQQQFIQPNNHQHGILSHVHQTPHSSATSRVALQHPRSLPSGSAALNPPICQS